MFCNCEKRVDELKINLASALKEDLDSFTRYPYSKLGGTQLEKWVNNMVDYKVGRLATALGYHEVNQPEKKVWEKIKKVKKGGN